MPKWTKTETREAIENLRERIVPGTTVYTVLRNCSRSGMTRAIDCYLVSEDGDHEWISRLVAKALDISFSERYEAVSVGGCGMDMGYHIVHELGATLYPDGFECVGEDREAHRFCPSNDHSNGDRDYTPHPHKSGGYALNHRWI